MLNNVERLPQSNSLLSIANSLGRVVEITEQGVVMVDFPNNPYGPQVARLATSVEQAAELEQYPVLLLFDNDDPRSPIIIGLVKDKLSEENLKPDINLSATVKPQNVLIDGKKLTFDAKEEIVLQCGKSSITLRQNGKVIIKGANLISRSSGANKIKGSSVNIN